MKKRKEKLESRVRMLQAEINGLEENRQKVYERITGVRAERFRIINQELISVPCETFAELQNILTYL